MKIQGFSSHKEDHLFKNKHLLHHSLVMCNKLCVRYRVLIMIKIVKFIFQKEHFITSLNGSPSVLCLERILDKLFPWL